MIGLGLVLLAVVPVLVALGTRHVATRAVRNLAPRLATGLLTAYALTVSLATGFMLCLTAYLSTIEAFPAIHPRDWSTDTLRDTLPVPTATGLVAAGVAAVLSGRACVHLVRVLVSLRRTAAAAAQLPAVGDLAVVDDAAVHAYAVPGCSGRRGRVVVSTGLLRTLSGSQRRALLAHEQAHLRHHHHRYAQLARLAAAANPLMRPIAAAVDNAIERWADADAVREVGNPTTVAHALGLAALARPAVPARALGAARNDVVDRVRDLLEPPRRRADVCVAVVVAALMCWASVTTALLCAHHVVELAEAATRNG